jgi:hypothetical protein
MSGLEVLRAGAELMKGAELLLHAKRPATSINPASRADILIYWVYFIQVWLLSMKTRSRERTENLLRIL